MNKKAQSATEFVVLVSFMIIVFFIFFFVIQKQIINISQEQDKQYLIEASRLVSSELELAKNSLTDYKRTFKLKSFSNQEYDIIILDKQELVVIFKDLEYVKFLAYEVEGYLNNIRDNASNTVYKTDGIMTFPNGTIENNQDYELISLNINPELCYMSDKNDSSCPNLNTKTKGICGSNFTLCMG